MILSIRFLVLFWSGKSVTKDELFKSIECYVYISGCVARKFSFFATHFYENILFQLCFCCAEKWPTVFISFVVALFIFVTDRIKISFQRKVGNYYGQFFRVFFPPPKKEITQTFFVHPLCTTIFIFYFLFFWEKPNSWPSLMKQWNLIHDNMFYKHDSRSLALV